jgi:ribonuclease HI
MNSERRKLFYKTLGRWWQLAAMEGYDWSQPDTPETLQAEENLWESKELYENGDIKLSEVRPVFEAWVKTHRKLEAAQNQIVDAMRTERRREARI